MSALDDERLLTALGEVLESDEPLPATVADVEHEAFALRRLDAELAELLFDTATETTAAVRGDATRALSFAAAGRELDVELVPDGTLIGRVSPPDVDVGVESVTGTIGVRPDHLGRFTTAVTGRRLRVVLGDATTGRAVTPWIFR